MQKFPVVLSELNTIKYALRGSSIARFGDGEFRLAAGPPAKKCKTQEHHPRLQQELQRMLRGPTKALVCLPRIDPKLPTYERHWKVFEGNQWCDMIGRGLYGSSFISRPDSVPDIDVQNQGYWSLVRQLWDGRDVTLVICKPDANGKSASLTPDLLPRARSVRVVWGPEHHAYVQIDRIDHDIGTPDGVVLLCLGATATCLAERLAQRGVHALDLGHIGRHVARSASYDEVQDRRRG